MKKIIKIVKNNIIGIILGAIIFGTLGAYAATTLNSSEIYYNNTSSGGSSNTVSGAIDELYKISNERMTEASQKCPEGKDCLEKTLYNIIKTNASNETVDFSVRSGTSGTNGIYTTTATEGNVPVYYYRGNVNNNVIFNNMCWKIVRTTETGGVKLIYNGTPTDGQCLATTGDATQIGKSVWNTSYKDNAYVGYMYGTTGSSTYAETHANTNESTIKKYIDTWFKENFNSEAIAKLEDAVFCNDRSTTTGTNNNTLGSSYGSLGYGTNATAYGAAARSSSYTISPNPTLVCPQANDKFTVSESYGNGALTYPVGLITLDEVVFAGFNTKSSNTSDYKDTNNYLYTNSAYWTFSPVFMHTGGLDTVGTVYSAGNLGAINVRTVYGVRPAVSLADGTLVEPTGDGTSTNPYVVK